MTIRRFEGFEYTCDHCSKDHAQSGATSHYHNSTPPGWLTVLIKPCLGTDTERLLCDECVQLLFVDEDIQYCFDYDPFPGTED